VLPAATFPSLTNVEIVHVAVTEKCVLISARDAVSQPCCRSCGTEGTRHQAATYGAVEDRPVVIEIEVTRCQCDNPGCQLATFTHDIPALAPRRARRTPAIAV
jgi:hypothetical protein